MLRHGGGRGSCGRRFTGREVCVCDRECVCVIQWGLGHRVESAITQKPLQLQEEKGSTVSHEGLTHAHVHAHREWSDQTHAHTHVHTDLLVAC